MANLEKIFTHGDKWSPGSLMSALYCCTSSPNSMATANLILDYWDENPKQFNTRDVGNAIGALGFFLERYNRGSFSETARMDLATRIIGMLPKDVPFERIGEILFRYSVRRYFRVWCEETGVLTEENRKMLIEKSKKPSLHELKIYFLQVGELLENARVVDVNYREVHFDTLNQLLDLAQFSPHQIKEFFSFALVKCNEFAFIEPLIAKCQDQLTSEEKRGTLRALSPAGQLLGSGDFEKRIQLFAGLVDRWKADIALGAQQLYTNIFEDDFTSEMGTSEDGSEVQLALKKAYTQLHEIFLKAFPECVGTFVC